MSSEAERSIKTPRVTEKREKPENSDVCIAGVRAGAGEGAGAEERREDYN